MIREETYSAAWAGHCTSIDLTRELLNSPYKAPTAAFLLVIRWAILATSPGKNMVVVLSCPVVGKLANLVVPILKRLKQRPVSRPIWNPGNLSLVVPLTCRLGATLIKRSGGPLWWVRLPDSMLWKVFDALLGATLALGALGRRAATTGLSCL